MSAELRDASDSSIKEHHAAGVHGHEHEHEGAPDHRHPHHHGPEGGHGHAHTLGFERYTYLVSPVHDLDPRTKVISALVLVIAFVSGPAPQPVEFALIAALLLAVTLLSRVPLRWMLTRSLIVLPIAGGIALFAPLAHAEAFTWTAVAAAYASYSWLIWSILSKAWVSAYTALLLSATTPTPRLFKGLRALKMPAVFLTLLSFLYRFTEVFGEQLKAMRRAVACRAPALGGWRLIKLYGNLAGNLFIRSYDRGERIYAAMLSRGYDGTLPTAETLTMRAADWLVLATTLTAALALALY